ncbi:MAG TPA: glycosyltransferase family 2 protein [Clostridia bacterium]|nr:glycosyltransferase family 2 protein [Clostridia bacterium]
MQQVNNTDIKNKKITDEARLAFVSVIIPFYNEAGQVNMTLETTEQVLLSTGLRYEILAIDDGSKDSTWEELISYAKTNAPIRLFRFSRNFGKEAAICAGLDRAAGDAVIVMDGDLQHPPRYIPDMISLWREGFEVVEGVKTARGRESAISRLFANLFYGLFGKLSGYKLKNASDFKLLDRKVVDSWKIFSEKGTFFRALSAWMGFKRVTFPFFVDERSTGKSKWGFRKLFRLSLNALTGFSSRPLLLINSMGAVFLLVFFILAIQTLVRYFRGQAATGFTTVIMLQLLIGSIILISLGLIGIYIDSLFREVKARPRYLMSEIVETPAIENVDESLDDGDAS